jgi:hypothetical protein
MLGIKKYMRFMIAPLSQIMLLEPPQKVVTLGESTLLFCAIPENPLLY